jgi:isocitrate dehydrogenase
LSKSAVIINGDGTGPELVKAMVHVLQECNSKIKLIPCEAGSEWWTKSGGNSYISDEVWKRLEDSDACFKGPTTTIPTPNAPRSVAVSIRQRFNLYANVRPINSGIEFKIGDDAAIAVRKITRKSCENVVRHGFKVASEMKFKKVYVITKRNILKETDGIFWSAVQNIQSEFNEISVEEYYIDNMTQQLVKNPERFNKSILLSTNLFMDIVSECASGHVGSIGNVYSGNYGDNYAMFEPAHGSAPKYAGTDKVNPVATILSGALMAKYLGENEICNAIFAATEETINEGNCLTYDLGGSASLSKMANEIAKRSKTHLR